jgi:uncharacterized protein (DUF2336 family)
MAERGHRYQKDGRLLDPLSQADILRILKERGEGSEQLARREDAGPEVLFVLASEGTPAARRFVAANPATPAHANRLLAEDNDDDVRVELARKIGRLLPELSAEASEKLRTLTIETLECLAQDQLPRVRQMLAEEIKRMDCVPKHIVHALARDVESVAAPILEYSPLLSDSDLIDIITTAQARNALTAIARRKPLSGNVSDAIATAMDIPAVAALLTNGNAQIRQQTFDKIVDHAAKIRDWHAPLVMRNDLSQRAIRRIARFVSASLIDRLVSLHNLDDDTRGYLRQQMRERLNKDETGENGDAVQDAAAEVAARHANGRVDDAFVADAAQQGHREIVIAALALLGKVPPDIVHRIFQAASAKAVTALVWRAGLSMRVAFKIQTGLLRLPTRELLPARQGVHFPLTEDEMRWHLGYFGVEV